jgi:hypothetical protein
MIMGQDRAGKSLYFRRRDEGDPSVRALEMGMNCLANVEDFAQIYGFQIINFKWKNWSIRNKKKLSIRNK